MKRKSLLLFLFFLVSAIFANDWQIEEKKFNENRFWYFVRDTPSGYEYLKDTAIFALHNNHSYQNLYSESLTDKINEYLKAGKFEIKVEDGIKQIFLIPEFLNINLDLSKEELTSIWKILSKKYAGFSDMQKKGFNKKEFLEITKSDDLKKVFDKYIEDCHFSLNLREFSYSQNTAHDEGTFKSVDSDSLYFEKETSNAYYVRFTSCSTKEYMESFENLYLKALEKDYLIIDARSNHGGSNYPQTKLLNSLIKKNYKGTVYVLQDNWSYSSGEVWEVFGCGNKSLNCKLVGTHSGGMQNYGNCRTIENKKLQLSIYIGKSNFRKFLPENYLGEGKGYEPDIWATTETMASVLTGLGVDVSGIIFQ